MPQAALEAAGLHSPALFALSVLLMNATPGVDLLCVLSRTLADGRRAGLAAAAGISAGCVVHALLAAFGVAALLAVSAWGFALLKWSGAAYLAWLGWGQLRVALRRPAGAAGDAAAVEPVRMAAGTAFRQGLLTNVLNPKVALFFLAFLPQFMVPQAADRTAAFLWLGAWFVLQSLLFLVLLVFAAHTLQGWWRARRGPDTVGERATRVLQGLGGVLFLGLAMRLAVSDAPVPAR